MHSDLLTCSTGVMEIVGSSPGQIKSKIIKLAFTVTSLTVCSIRQKEQKLLGLKSG